MKKVKFLMGAAVLSSIFMMTSCSKEQGCTDQNAVNFDILAEENDGSCQYEGEIVFWYNSATSAELLSYDVVSLTYYVNGQVVGSSSADVYWSGAPDCGQNGSVTVTQNLGNTTNLVYDYSVVDDTGYEIWSGVANFTANTCTSIELTP